jgi:hypothetical protein
VNFWVGGLEVLEMRIGDCERAVVEEVAILEV